MGRRFLPIPKRLRLRLWALTSALPLHLPRVFYHPKQTPPGRALITTCRFTPLLQKHLVLVQEVWQPQPWPSSTQPRPHDALRLLEGHGARKGAVHLHVDPKSSAKEWGSGHHHGLPHSCGRGTFRWNLRCHLGLLVEYYGLQVRDVQMCPFGRGRTFVRVARVSDGDGLIAHSTHHFNDFNLAFVKHIRGDNARRVNFNREFWLMLICYPPELPFQWRNL